MPAFAIPRMPTRPRTELPPGAIIDRSGGYYTFRDPVGKSVVGTNTRPWEWPWAEYIPGMSNAPGSRYPQFSPSGLMRRDGTEEKTGSSSLYAPLEVVKSPSTAGAVKGLFGELNQGQGFDEILSQMRDAGKGVGAAYNREQQAYNLGDYADRQRASDDRLAGLTQNYAANVGNIGSRYADVNAAYEGRSRDALDAYLANAGKFLNEDIPLALKTTAGIVGEDASKYAISRGGGMGSDIESRIARNYTRAALPYMLQGRQVYGEALSRYPTFYGDVASREAQRLSNFEYPAARDVYGQFAQTEQQRKNTESQVKQLEIATAGMSRQAAESYLRSLALPVEIIQSVLQKKIANLGQLAGIENEAYYRGLEYLPGSGPLAVAQGFGNFQGPYPQPPNYQQPSNLPPSRYPQTVGTGNTNAGPAGNPGSTGTYGNPNYPDWLIAQRIERGEQIPGDYFKNTNWVPGNPIEVGPNNQFFQSDADRGMSLPISRYG